VPAHNNHRPAAVSRGLVDEHTIADLLCYSVKTVQNWRLASRNVGPPYIKLTTGTVRYSLDAVEEWLKSCTVGSGEAA
jgi:predicted DNA-binding transcriptional regulator AlpA